MISEDALRSIEKLHELKAKDILSESEFEAAKLKLLSGKMPASSRSIPKAHPLERPRDDDYAAWALLPIRRYAQFTGRSGRREFWLFFLAINIVIGALGLVWMSDTDYEGTGSVGALAALTMVLGAIGVAVPYVAVQVRRLHDQGRSGLFALMNLIPYIGAFALLVLMAMEGAREDNEFGPDPRA